MSTGYLKATMLARLAQNICPRCLCGNLERQDNRPCAMNREIGTCIKQDYNVGIGFGQEYGVRDGYELTDPDRYNFDNLMSKEELAEIMRGSA